MRILFAALLVLAPAVASAQSRADRRAAQRLFQAGQDLYGRAEYLDAAASFQAAYEKVPDASFLFNAARAYERGNDLEKAIASYEAYLSAAPDAPDVVEVESKVATLRQRQQARDRTEQPAPEPQAAPAETTPDAAPPKPGLPTHSVAVGAGPVFFFSGGMDMARLAGEYRYGLSPDFALAAQVSYVPALVSGQSGQRSGWGLHAGAMLRLPFGTIDGLVRAGVAFESYSSRAADQLLLALRIGPGALYRFTDGFGVEIDVLASPGMLFTDSSTLGGEGGDSETAFALEAVASVVFGL